MRYFMTVTVDRSVEMPTRATVGHAARAIALETGSLLSYVRPRLRCAVCSR